MFFIEKGFHATRGTQIARRSDVAGGRICRDVDDREAIGAAVVEGDCTMFAARQSPDRALDAIDSPMAWDWPRP